MATNQKVLYPCSLCSKNVVNDAIYCDICGFWVHRSCSKLSKKQLDIKSNPDYYYFCPKCAELMPFMHISNEDLDFLNYDESMSDKVYNVHNKFKGLRVNNLSYF